MMTESEREAVGSDAAELERAYGPDWEAILRMVATLRSIPEGDRRTDALAVVCRVYVAHPDLRPE
jgi:hypothetical protein